jgi:hypothetical protein
MANKTRRTVTLSPELDAWLSSQPNASGTVERAIARARDEQQTRLRVDVSPRLAEALDKYAEAIGSSRAEAVRQLLTDELVELRFLGAA